MTAKVEDWPALQEEVFNAISEILSRRGKGDLLTKFVLVAESVDTSGERIAWCLDQRDARRWDVLGLLHWALNMEESGSVINLLAEVGEEDNGPD